MTKNRNTLRVSARRAVHEGKDFRCNTSGHDGNNVDDKCCDC